MQIAVTSHDGVMIDQHFGHADRFIVYEVMGGSAQRIGERTTGRYCTYDPDHPLRAHLLEEIAAALAGCRVILTHRIGEAPRRFLEERGFDVFELSGNIDDAVIGVARLYD
ncbi:MAG: NifB/NifX family molybdenum-iron cluster-binding protein [Desulfuromonadia bacterium]